MARKQEIVITLTDDVDGSSKGIETVSFGVDGAAYEIDLGPKNAKALRADLEKWATHARKVKRTSPPRAKRPAAAKAPSEASAIRTWAAENDIPVPARGRIPSAVAELYAAR